MTVRADGLEPGRLSRQFRLRDVPVIARLDHSGAQVQRGIRVYEVTSGDGAAVDSGAWPMYRFDPRRREKGKNPFQLDCKGNGPRKSMQIYHNMP